MWGGIRRRRGVLLLAFVALAAAANAPHAVGQSSDAPLGPECDPNYDLVCVPIASDVDCAGGNGNGPAYVRGPVRVVGRDIYKLDRDGDGYACEPTN